MCSMAGSTVGRATTITIGPATAAVTVIVDMIIVGIIIIVTIIGTTVTVLNMNETPVTLSATKIARPIIARVEGSEENHGSGNRTRVAGGS
jgi:hypothetical protein